MPATKPAQKRVSAQKKPARELDDVTKRQVENLVERPMNDRMRRFGELVVLGRPAGRAYEEAGYGSKGAVADSSASILLRNPKVAEYNDELRAESRSKTALTLEEHREYLAKAIRTPLGEVDERSVLAQEVTYTDGPQGSSKKIKMVSRLAALELDAKLAGYIKPSDMTVNIHIGDTPDQTRERLARKKEMDDRQKAITVQATVERIE